MRAIRKCKSVIQIFVFSLIGCSTYAQADQSEIVTDRPDQSDTPIIIPKGSLQVETGFFAEHDRQPSITYTNVLYNTTLIKYGVNEHFELRLNAEAIGAYRKESEQRISRSGINPISIGVKVKLSEQKGYRPQAGFESHLNLKIGSKEFTPAYTATNFRFLFAHTFNSWTLSYNLGARWDGQNPHATFLYTLSLESMVNHRTSVFMETYSFFPEVAMPDHRMDAGILYKLSSLWQIDFSCGLGLSDNAPDFFVSTGVAARFLK